MNKTELIAAVSESTGLSRKDVGTVIDAVVDEVTSVVAKGDEKVTIPGLASFERVDRPARKGFNPQTKEPLEIPASKGVKVTALKKLKDAARG